MEKISKNSNAINNNPNLYIHDLIYFYNDYKVDGREARSNSPETDPLEISTKEFLKQPIMSAMWDMMFMCPAKFSHCKVN